MKRERVERNVSGKRYFVYPEEDRIRIVKELEKGSLSIKEVMQKYEVLDASTVLNWLKRYSSEYRENYMRVLLSVSDRRQIAYKVESGVMSIEEATTRYRVQQRTIKSWIKLYTCIPKLVDTMAKNEQSQSGSSEQTKALQKQIEQLKLKVEALETMIDIAEDQLKIDIRKKSGTKQSKP
ncbi:MAG: hypothetical protein HXX14_16740 [Bacteroidetes bacterium]|nr:hypothetical protein [Bacteroidota bacterium]NWJ52506.1 hypothetical protein [Bacteroidota bacterium]